MSGPEVKAADVVLLCLAPKAADVVLLCLTDVRMLARHPTKGDLTEL